MSKDDEYGVLLYYKFTFIPDVDSLLSFYDSNCNSLGLLGRVRLSPNGVNVTIKSNAFVCEMCQKHRKDIGSIPFLENSEPEAVSA